MSVYRVFDLNLDSELPLPELAAGDGKIPDLTFRWRTSLDAEPVPGTWRHHWHDEAGRRWLSAASDGTTDLLRIYKWTDFVLTEGGSRIDCTAGPDTSADTLRHQLLDTVVPLIVSRRASLVLHAGALLRDAGAILLLGQTGFGKSTLVTALGRRGLPVLTDDCLLVRERGESFLAVPSYPGVRLLPTSAQEFFGTDRARVGVAEYTPKERFGPANLAFSGVTAPIARIFVLDAPASETRDVSLARLTPRDAAMALVAHHVLLDIHDERRNLEEFEFILRLVGRVPVYCLAYPRRFSELDRVMEAVLNPSR